MVYSDANSIITKHVYKLRMTACAVVEKLTAVFSVIQKIPKSLIMLNIDVTHTMYICYYGTKISSFIHDLFRNCVNMQTVLRRVLRNFRY